MKKQIQEMKIGDVFKFRKRNKTLYMIASRSSMMFVNRTEIIKLLKGGNITEGIDNAMLVYLVGCIGPDGKLIE